MTLLLRSAEHVLSASATSGDLSAIRDLSIGLVGPYAAGRPLLRSAGLLPPNEDGDDKDGDGEVAVQTEEGKGEGGAQPTSPSPSTSTSTPSDPPLTFEVRAFFGPTKVEDPATGSLNAGIAKWLIAGASLVGDENAVRQMPSGATRFPLAPKRYTASQGTAMGRKGRIYVHQEGEEGEGDTPTIWVAGDCKEVICGTVTI